MPVTGESWTLEESHFPKALYWDAFAASGAATAIHFRDVPDLRDLECPDTSHLDMRDAPRFTKVLIRELNQRCILPPPARGITGESKTNEF
jgi:hypothetical protein